MKKVKVKVPAKINLTLDILGVKDGYHIIDSLVVSVDVYDTVTVKPRKENLLNVTFDGIPVGIAHKNSNAYYAAEKFRKEFSTGGADITIKRNIPVAAGLGGSSADIAGVLSAMKKLYKVKRDISFIANDLGSDAAYMLKGGYAVIKNRGEQVEPLENIKRDFYILIVLGKSGVSAGDSYKTYDKINKTYAKSTPIAVKLLTENDADNFLTTLKNDLYEGSCAILPEIKQTAERLKEYGAAVMTGSGSAVYGIYKTKRCRDKAYKALFSEYGDRLIKAKTVK